MVMHGYGGDRKAVSRDLDELSARGVIAAAPDMRGRGSSAGVWDSGGLDVHDIHDAAEVLLRQLGDEVERHNVNVIGYSGGGGNALAAACRFPGYFNTAVSFFGIPDYAGWHRSEGRVDCNATMERVLGTPEQAPAKYEARDMIPAAGNARLTRMHLIWDVEETACPGEFNDKWIKAYRAAVPKAEQHVAAHVSKPGDKLRWHHGYRTDNPMLTAADDLYLPDVFAGPIQARGRHDRSRLPDEGELVVPGYVNTGLFRVFVADGQAGRIRIRYRRLPDTSPTLAAVEVLENPRALPVKIDVSST
jgi:pimeloyl-ACP methyl ester carboxylesterase